MSDQDWINIQAAKWTAERRAELAVQTANKWRDEARRLQAELDAARAEIERLTREIDQ